MSKAETAEQKGRPANAVPRWVVMIEGSAADAVRNVLHEQLAPAALAAFALADVARGVYGLQFDLLA